jgi:hypothetical protein
VVDLAQDLDLALEAVVARRVARLVDDLFLFLVCVCFFGFGFVGGGIEG